MDAEKSGCCCKQTASINKASYIEGFNGADIKAVTKVSTELSSKDFIGALRVRLGMGRMNYKVEPGLYRTGKPNENSPVLVTANYKLTFDILRKNLTGINAWILVLDTNGVNVWCAAGKGTFGTKELVNRIKIAELGKIVKHRTVILPQLGATGVAAHEVANDSGFHVIYGPVRATDIKEFLGNGMKATTKMRTVRFNTLDRLVLTPVDFGHFIKPLTIFYGVLFILNVFGLGRFGLLEFIGFFGAVITGSVITPLLLPLIPARAFSLKGAILGILWTACLLSLSGGFVKLGIMKTAAYVLLLPSVSAFAAMNFTGSSTYTSPTGVNKEMHIAIPSILAASILGAILLVADSVINIFY